MRPAARRARGHDAVLAAGALGYGGSVLLQDVGISRTSVTHAALLIGAVPVLVAIIAAVWHRTVARPVAWFGFALSLGGVGLSPRAAGRRWAGTAWCWRRPMASRRRSPPRPALRRSAPCWPWSCSGPGCRPPAPPGPRPARSS
jgi:EamA-like transporter family